MSTVIDYALTLQSDGRIQPRIDGEPSKPGFLGSLQDKNIERYLRFLKSRDKLREREDFTDFGSLLYDALLKPVEISFADVWKRVAREEDARLRLRLVFQQGAMEAARLPWELLYHEDDNTFLGTDPRVAMSREYEDWLPSPADPVGARLRVVFVHNHPEDLAEVGFSKLVRDELSGLDAQAEIEELANPTIEELRATFERRPHVLHFLGHGTLGKLALRAADGNALWYADQSLADLLRAGGVRLAVLQACEGAAISEDQSFAGPAARLVQQHVPAVVGLRYPIDQPAAWRFVKKFYRELADGVAVDFAVQAGRRALASPDDAQVHASRDFGAPVLWLRPGSDQLLPAGDRRPLPSTRQQSRPAAPVFSVREREILTEYLDALIRDTQELDPGGIRQTYTKATSALPLEEIYVDLQAERDRPDVDRRVMEEELDDIKKRLEEIEDAQERERQYQVWATQARILERALQVSPDNRVDLSKLAHRRLVLLGDPGSGKTTLLRYLALRFAHAVRQDADRLLAPQDWWDADRAWRLPDLGPVRLPLLMRISRYAESRNPDQGGNPDLTLAEYLPRYLKSHLNLSCSVEELTALVNRCLQAGRCLVLLDGLDEIIEPRDRREIATNIQRFSGSFDTAGLPAWTGRPVEIGGHEVAEDWDQVMAKAWEWEEGVPREVRKAWRQRLQRRSSLKAKSLAAELLGDASSAHLGNRFLVTSRIAGYHFARISGDFEHYTLLPLSLDGIERFLNRWCPVAERRITEAPDRERIETRARREVEGIMAAVRDYPGVRRMAQNPLMLRILAIIHRNERHLPQRRIELYETATITLLRDWNLERGLGKEVVIDEHRALGLLGPIAYWIHQNRPTGLLTRGEVETRLARILSEEQGEDPDHPSLSVQDGVAWFLDTVRQYSGLFVERGEGLFGFMHLTFEEYFTARRMVSRSGAAKEIILSHLHQPRWREPTLLAVGFMSKNFYDDTHDLLRVILDHGSDYESLLHRDLLFAADCVADSVNVAPKLTLEIARRLLEIYTDREGAGRYRRLRTQVRQSLRALNNEQGNEAVEAALAEALGWPGRGRWALEAVEWLEPRSAAVGRALEEWGDPVTLLEARRLLRDLRARSGGTVGWEAYRDDPALAWLLGAMWGLGSRNVVESRLGLPQTVQGNLTELWQAVDEREAIALADKLDEDLAHWLDQRGDEDLLQRVEEQVQQVRYGSPFWPSAYRLQTSLGIWMGTADQESEKAIEDFRDLVRKQRETVASFDLATAIVQSGQRILEHASGSATLAPLLAEIAPRFAVPEGEGDDLEAKMRDAFKGVNSQLAEEILTAVGGTTDPIHFLEALLFLISLGQRQQVGEQVWKDFESGETGRQRLSLLFLNDSEGRNYVQPTPEHLKQIHAFLEGDLPEASLALQILLARELTATILDWCWGALRQSRHPLEQAVREGLDEVRQLPGSQEILTLVAEGLRDSHLRPVALELLHQVEWREGETLPQALVWLDDDDLEIRYLAAVLLAGPQDLGDEFQALLLRKFPVLELELPPFENGEQETWAALADDPKVVRLLGGLWLQGWANTLTILWVGRTARPYLKENYRTWPQNQPEAENTASWMLNRVKGHPELIPLSRRAAERFAELEADETVGTPTREHLDIVMAPLISLLTLSPENAWLLPARIVHDFMGQPENPVRRWTRETLESRGPDPASVKQLASLLVAEDEARLAAALQLLVTDLPATIVRNLLEAIQVTGDRVRRRAGSALENLCSHLPVDDYSAASRLMESAYLEVIAQRPSAGRFTQVILNRIRELRFSDPKTTGQWLERFPTSEGRIHAPVDGVSIPIFQVSQEVSTLICAFVRDASRSQAVRRTAVSALFQVRRSNSAADRSEFHSTETLIKVLSDQSVEIRREVAYTLQWTEDQGIGQATEALLQVAREDPDLPVQVWALRSLGRLLGIMQQYGDTDISKEELFRWLVRQCPDDLRWLLRRQFLSESRILAAADSEAALARLGQVDDLASPEAVRENTGTNAKWPGLLESTQREWKIRTHRVETYARCAEAIDQLEAWLSSQEGALVRAGACALARAYPVDDRLAHLEEQLSDNSAVLWALIDGASLRDHGWSDDQSKMVEQLADWLGGQLAAERDRLVQEILVELVRETECVDYEEAPGFEGGSPLQAVLLAVLATLSERFTYRTLIPNDDLDRVTDLLARFAKSDKWANRKFALRALGNFQRFTPEVAEAFFAACQETGEIYDEARSAVTKFKHFAPGSLERLTSALSHESATVAYHAAQLLGELGASRSEELGGEGRQRVATELERFLAQPLARRPVYDDEDNKQPLYDVVYEAMLQVVTGEALGETA